MGSPLGAVAEPGPVEGINSTPPEPMSASPWFSRNTFDGAKVIDDLQAVAGGVIPAVGVIRAVRIVNRAGIQIDIALRGTGIELQFEHGIAVIVIERQLHRVAGIVRRISRVEIARRSD